jgi:hypothetical protein
MSAPDKAALIVDDDDCVPTNTPPGHDPNCVNAFCYCQTYKRKKEEKPE